MNVGDIEAKFSYETRKHTRNVVIEVSVQTRKLLLDRRVKLGWQICKIEDYVVVSRCYKCPDTTVELATAEERTPATFVQALTN